MSEEVWKKTQCKKGESEGQSESLVSLSAEQNTHRGEDSILGRRFFTLERIKNIHSAFYTTERISFCCLAILLHWLFWVKRIEKKMLLILSLWNICGIINSLDAITSSCSHVPLCRTASMTIMLPGTFYAVSLQPVSVCILMASHGCDSTLGHSADSVWAFGQFKMKSPKSIHHAPESRSIPVWIVKHIDQWVLFRHYYWRLMCTCECSSFRSLLWTLEGVFPMT